MSTGSGACEISDLFGFYKCLKVSLFGYYYSESKTKVKLSNKDLSHCIKDFIMFSEITPSPFT